MIIESSTTGLMAELRDRVEGWPGLEWVGGRLFGDALVLVVRRMDGVPAGQLEGLRVPVDAAVLQRDAALREAVLVDVVLEIVRADGPAVPLPVTWADDLVIDPREVRWRGDAVATFARAALGRLHDSVQGCGGSPL